MARKIFLFVWCCCCLMVSAQEIRFMSYNVRNAKGMDDRTDFDRVARVIQDACPDVVGVQESDSVTRRSNGRFVLEEIGHRTGYSCSYAPAIDYQGGKYGIGILFKKKPQCVHYISLPGREERRALLVAEFKKYIVCVAHLSLTAEHRMASLPLILEETSKINSDKPIFFAGDFNDEPDSDFINSLKQHFDILSDIAKPTFPSDNPNVTIDYICHLKRTGEHVAVKDYQVMAERMASDHRPILATLNINNKHNK